jgi:hypothetical protein
MIVQAMSAGAAVLAFGLSPAAAGFEGEIEIGGTGARSSSGTTRPTIGLRKVAEPPVQPVAGIGDQFYTTFDKDSKRYTLTAVKRAR